jgi:transposase
MEFFPQSVVDAKQSTKKQLKGGIDAHKKGCNICLLNEKGEKVKVKRISTSYESFDKFFSPLLKEYDVEVAIEVGNLVFVICDNLSFLKVDSYIVNPLKNRMIADSFQKTDKRDANTLAFQLWKGMLPPRVYHATYPERELRSLVNHSHKLVGDRTRIANRTHALLLRNGKSN